MVLYMKSSRKCTVTHSVRKYVIMRCDQKYGECCCWVSSHSKAGSSKRDSLPTSTLFTGSGTVWFLALPQVKMSMKDKCFQSVQDMKAARTAQVKTFTETDFHASHILRRACWLWTLTQPLSGCMSLDKSLSEFLCALVSSSYKTQLIMISMSFEWLYFQCNTIYKLPSIVVGR